MVAAIWKCQSGSWKNLFCDDGPWGYRKNIENIKVQSWLLCPTTDYFRYSNGFRMQSFLYWKIQKQLSPVRTSTSSTIVNFCLVENQYFQDVDNMIRSKKDWIRYEGGAVERVHFGHKHGVLSHKTIMLYRDGLVRSLVSKLVESRGRENIWFFWQLNTFVSSRTEVSNI